MPKYIPLLCSTPVVEALIAKRKTKTRRTTDLDKVNECPDDWSFHAMELNFKEKNCAVFYRNSTPLEKYIIPCRYGNVGDVIWVRECFQQRSEKAMLLGFEKYYYKAGWNGCTEAGWKPSLFMPKAACRFFLQVKSIKAERLNDISDQDAIAEGIEQLHSLFGYKNYLNKPFASTPNAIYSFQTLWQSINGKDSWNKNPWVWVIEFEQISKPVNFLTTKK